MKAIGLMAGTSLDGISAAVVELKSGSRSGMVSLLAFRIYPYSGETVRYILEASDPRTGTVDKVARLNFYLGELFAEAALDLLRRSGLKSEEIAFIGSHGQTIHHLPTAVSMGKHRVRATLQVGEPSVIAVRTGITTVADFRPADIAAGGEGAPLVPFVDYLLFHHPRRTRFLVNIGGIANGSIVSRAAKDPAAVLASDIGPGNMVINELCSRMTNFKEIFDRDGRYAARGKTQNKILAELLAGPFFAEAPPKSTGRERFGAAYVQNLLKKYPPSGKEDFLNLIATATELTAAAIHQHYEKFYARQTPVDEVIVSGGGAKNLTLMRLLSERFAPIPVAASDEYGIPALAKEAIAFAILGRETLAGRPANLPGATGAKQQVILGKIIPGTMKKKK